MDRTWTKLKFKGFLVKDRDTCNITWQHIRRELNTLELTTDGFLILT